MIFIDCKVCGKKHPMGSCGKKMALSTKAVKGSDLLRDPFEEPLETVSNLKAGYNEYMKLLMRERRGGLKRKPKE
jgi:hypothetical protein